MDAQRGAERDALDVAVDGLDCAAALARDALESGDRDRAERHILQLVADLEPELAELRRRHPLPRATPRIVLPAPAGAVGAWVPMVLSPLAILCLQLLFPVLRVAGFSPYVIAVAAAAHVCGFRTAVATLAATVVCTAYSLSLTSTEPYELGLRVACSTGAMLVLARWLGDEARPVVRRPV